MLLLINILLLADGASKLLRLQGTLVKVVMMLLLRYLVVSELRYQANVYMPNELTLWL